MPVYKGSEPSVELQSTEAFKGCEGAAAGEEELVKQIVNIGQCMSNACKGSK